MHEMKGPQPAPLPSRRARPGPGKLLFLCLAILALAGTAPMRAAGKAWDQPSRPLRMMLDWRPSDMPPASAVELFLDSEKFGAATGEGKVSPRSFTFVAERTDGSTVEMPFAFQVGASQFNLRGITFRMQPPPGARRLWMYFGGVESEGPPLETNWNLMNDFLAPESAGEWKTSHPSLTITPAGTTGLSVAFDDRSADIPDTLEFSRSFPVPPDCRGTGAFVSFDLKLTGEGYVPITIQLQQFDQHGKRLNACVVDPRWLALCLAAGQQVNLRERGFFYAETASVRVAVSLRGREARNSTMAPEAGWLKYPASDAFQLQLSRAEIRAAHPIRFPGFAQEHFAPGISSAEDDLAFVAGNQVTGLSFDAHPPAVWSEGVIPVDPVAYHWPLGAGTFECWVMPEWNEAAPGKRYIMQASIGAAADTPALDLYYTPATGQIHLDGHAASVALTAHRWNHIAYTWDPEGGRRELFVNGRSVLSKRGEPIKAAAPGDPQRIPGRVWLGHSREICYGADESLHGRIDEVRISDGVRYTGDFTPAKQPFAPDASTRALFHFDGRKDGVHAGEDGRIVAAIFSPIAQIAARFSFDRRDGAGSSEAGWLDTAVPDDLDPRKLFEIEAYTPPSAAEFHQAFVEKRATFHLKPGETATLTCADTPRMDWVELRCPDNGQTVISPFLARTGEADPRSLQKLVGALAQKGASSGFDRANDIFRYLVKASNYRWNDAMNILPTGSTVSPGACSPILLNSYLEFGCGDLNTLTRDAFLAAGLSANMTHGSAHLYEQVFYDGSWHLYDLSPRVFAPARDNSRAASLAEVEEDPYLMTRVTGSPKIKYWLPSHLRRFQFPSRQSTLPEISYQLRPGEAFRYHWYNAGRYNPMKPAKGERTSVWAEATAATGETVGWSTHFPPYSSNGVFSFSCTPRADHPALAEWNSGEFVYKFFSPYTIVGAVVRAISDRGLAAAISLSYDDGKTWVTAPAPHTADGMADLDRLTAARHYYWLKITPPPGDTVTRFEHQAIVMMNPMVLTPELSKGDNPLRFTADQGASVELTIQYREPSAQPLAIEGGVKFGWKEDQAGQLFVSQPGQTLNFEISGTTTQPSLVAPRGITATFIRTPSSEKWRATLDLAPGLPEDVYEIGFQSGDRTRRCLLLVAKSAQLITAEQATRAGEASLIDDPSGIRGRVLQLETGSSATMKFTDPGTGPLAVFALAKLAKESKGRSVIKTAASGDRGVPFIESVYAHAVYHQDNLLTEWKWYHPMANSYPYETLAAVNLAKPEVTFEGITGQLLLASMIVLPAKDEKLIETLTHHLFSANYRPALFDRNWGPVVTGKPFPVR